ncbi:hypothetical protein GRI40_09470 [Altererythrobacter aerius]|uniref:Uncharacterized protein n=1 Tax=Tsuneonella aeria TaxID=1837929 RepID=A0A6I4TDY4_9SPHN|nr:hypothetical protein [Tsuneonella aeria]MXO75442.1 hypothetical protein [Tsuneonella aeria]
MATLRRNLVVSAIGIGLACSGPAAAQDVVQGTPPAGEAIVLPPPPPPVVTPPGPYAPLPPVYPYPVQAYPPSPPYGAPLPGYGAPAVPYPGPYMQPAIPAISATQATFDRNAWIADCSRGLRGDRLREREAECARYLDSYLAGAAAGYPGYTVVGYTTRQVIVPVPQQQVVREYLAEEPVRTRSIPPRPTPRSVQPTGKGTKIIRAR